MAEAEAERDCSSPGRGVEARRDGAGLGGEALRERVFLSAFAGGAAGPRGLCAFRGTCSAVRAAFGPGVWKRLYLSRWGPGSQLIEWSGHSWPAAYRTRWLAVRGAVERARALLPRPDSAARGRGKLDLWGDSMRRRPTLEFPLWLEALELLQAHSLGVEDVQEFLLGSTEALEVLLGLGYLVLSGCDPGRLERLEHHLGDNAAKKITVRKYVLGPLNVGSPFRQRDDIVSTAACLRELCSDPHHVVWREMKRGCVHEVRQIKILSV